MKLYLKLNKLSFFIFLLFISCNTEKKELTSIQFLPAVVKTSFASGDSGLNAQTIFFAYSPTASALPIRYGKLNDIGTTDRPDKANIIYGINPELELPADGYTIHIGAFKVLIEAKDAAGLFYAFITLNQLFEDTQSEGQNLPLTEIKDGPVLGYRSIHLDVKHHLEKESYYYELIDHLARQKINGIIVELEDKLKYKRRPEVAAADAFTIGQWIALSDYAKARHIRISPLIQGLGHASFILKHNQNKHLRDDPKSDWAFNPLDPQTYALQFDLYLDAIEATPHGTYLHVGGDEVHTTGSGSGKSALELQLFWLDKVSEFAAKHNRIPIFWDDMPLKQADLMQPIYDTAMSKAEVDSIWKKNEYKLNAFINQFPKNCIYMRWNYHAAETYGNLKAMDWFVKNDFEVMGATAGQTRWPLMPLREGNIDQIRSFALSSAERNFRGLLLTLWDDDSPHFELYKRGIAAFAEYTWAGAHRSKDDFKATYRHRTYGAAFAPNEFAFIDDLDAPVGAWVNVLLNEGVHRNSLMKSTAPIAEKVIDLPDPNRKGEWSRYYAKRLNVAKENRAHLNQVAMTLAALQKKTAKNQYSLDIYEQVIALAQFSFNTLLLMEAYDRASTSEDTAKALEAIYLLPQNFENMRKTFEAVYSKTRILNKPKAYILDQDHHNHPANQTINFDWQFYAEMLFLEKVNQQFKPTEWDENVPVKQVQILE